MTYPFFANRPSVVIVRDDRRVHIAFYVEGKNEWDEFQLVADGAMEPHVAIATGYALVKAGKEAAAMERHTAEIIPFPLPA
ncbi:MAG: hypothetical protein AAGB07_15605 [Pseudomonadota bacterium]